MKIPVLVTAIGGVGGEVVKALRLADTPYRIIGTDTVPNVWGAHLLEYFRIVPAADNAWYVDVMLAICESFRADVLIPGSDAEMVVLSSNRNRFDNILLPINPLVVSETCLDKWRLMNALQGEDTPEWLHATRLNDLRTIDFYPAVMKPSVDSGGSRDVVIAQDVSDAMFYGRYLFEKYSQIIVQEYVGTPDDEYTVGVLCDMEGTIINSIAMRRFIRSGISNRLTVKNRTRKKDLGEDLVISSGVSQGEIVDNPDVTAPCEMIAKRLGCRGPMNLQGRLVANRFYVFEINARFSASCSIRALMGFNEPDLLVRKYVLGEDIPYRFEFKKGIVLRGLQEVIL